MSFFSKLNLKQVSNGLRLKALFCLYSNLLIKVYQTANYYEENIDLKNIFDKILNETAEEIAKYNVGKVNATATIQRLAGVMDETYGQLTLLSEFPSAIFVGCWLEPKLDQVEKELLFAAKKGYLDEDLVATMLLINGFHETRIEGKAVFDRKEATYQTHLLRKTPVSNGGDLKEKRKKMESQRQQIEAEQQEFRRLKKDFEERNDASKDPHIINPQTQSSLKNSDEETQKNAARVYQKEKSPETGLVVFCHQCGSKNILTSRKLEKRQIFQPICAQCSSRLNV